MKGRSIQLVENVFPTMKYLTREMVLPYKEAQFTLVTPAVHIHYGTISLRSCYNAFHIRWNHLKPLSISYALDTKMLFYCIYIWCWTLLSFMRSRCNMWSGVRWWQLILIYLIIQMEAKVVHDGAFVENNSLPDNYYLKCASDTPLIQTIELLPCRLTQWYSLYVQHLPIKLKH